MNEVALSDGQMTLVDSKHYLDVVYAGPWHYHQHHTGKGYVSRWMGKGKTRRKQKLHHFIADKMGLFYTEIDHKNGDGLDNREENLRPATSSQNAMNRDVRSDNTTGLVGVCFQKADNIYTVQVNGKYIGCYKTLEEAKSARTKASQTYQGEFRRIDNGQ